MTRPASPPTNLAYRVRTLGRIHHEPYHWTPGTWFDDVMLTVVLDGRGVYRRGPLVFHLGVGSVGLVMAPTPTDPDFDAGLLMADPDDPYDHLYCRFAGQQARQAARRILARHGIPADQPLGFFTSDRWHDLAQVLLRSPSLGFTAAPPGCDDGEPERPTRHDAVLAEALAILEETTPPPAARAAVTTERLRTYLHDHVADPTDLQRVADHFHIGKAHLCRVARAALGDTLQRAWERIKLERARWLLREPSLSIADVARRVGYADPLYFSKVFRHAVGVSPRRWRGENTASSRR
jgi:AraC-like DNA-binding protein